MTSEVLGLDHVTITTPEELETEVVDWYETCVGLRRLDKTEGGGAWFEIGHQELHIMIDPHNPPKNAHFSLRVSDFADFVAQLRAANCHIEQATPRPGQQRCFTRDPAGNSIEIVAEG